MKRLAIIALATIIATCAYAQRTTKLTASKANDFGVVYSLPYTVFDIAIEAEMTERQPGDFSNYSRLYLNADNAIKVPQYSAKIKSVTVTPRGVPDENNRWMAEFKGSGITYMLLDEAGVPISINTEDVQVNDAPELPKARAASPTPLETDAASQAITQEMIASTSMNKRAQLAAQRIFELRDIRSDLISGNAENTPPDGKSMQLMLDNLQAQEAALTAMFVGTEKNWTDVHTVTFTPNSNETSEIIARVSPTTGIVDVDDLSGIPVYLSIKVLSTGKLPADENGTPKKTPKDGVAYNIPGTVQLTISFGDRQVYSAQYETAQFGNTFFLDSKIFSDKKRPAIVTFNPTTGGIISIETTTKE